ncbi:hypothetical protein [Synechococcus sp. WH 8016]|uniref:hypothetical protein n=1 Tax=Synechococcus sp. WH 8016 TaxID=166318 RepID=UPI00022DA169|nr:hypothetical protein [Synechococcus sp. WH 8016]EHA63753.1 hypothetical protein Syn8016DRAFT_0794 [Synechococcus sp. WH 8016]
MIRKIKLRSLAAKTLLASYCSLTAGINLGAITHAAPLTMQEALDSFNQSPQPEPEDIPVPVVHAPTQALLETIAYAEGTWDEKTQSINYSMRFADRAGQGTLDTDHPHPRQIRGSRYGSGYRSDASGAYQFLSTTWIGLHNGTNQVMSPENQDSAALKLVRATGYDVNRPFRHQAHRLASTWASFPTRNGWSFYGQPSKGLHLLDSFFQKRMAVHQTYAKLPIDEPRSYCYLEEKRLVTAFA